MKKEKILFFSPFQAIEKHAFPEAALALTLPKDKFEVSYLGCGKMFQSFCIAHTANGLTELASDYEKNLVCELCVNSRKQVFRHFPSSDVLDFYYDRSWEFEIDQYIHSLSRTEIYESKFHGIFAARIAAFEFILEHKIFEIEAISDEQFSYYKIRLKPVLRALLAFRSYAARNTFDKLFVYIQPYSVNNVVRAVAKDLNKKVAFAHPGYNWRHLNESIYFSWSTTVDNYQDSIKYYLNSESQIELDYSKFRLSLDQFEEQTVGKSYFNYSVNKKRNLKKISEIFHLNGLYKKVVLLAMSSSDEAYAADFSFKDFQFSGAAFQVFPDQAEWLKFVVEYFRERPEYKLIVRIHPREFPNQREKVLAPKVKVYQEILANLPENISLDHPDQKNSIYDLFEIVDFVLAAQSSIGFDAARLGVPVIASVDGLGIYSTRSICHVPENVEQYRQLLESFLKDDSKNSFSSAVKALEWNLFLYTKGVIPFQVHGFWEFYERKLVGRILRKLKSKVLRLRYSFSTYLSQISISEKSVALFQEFVESGKEMVSLKAHGRPIYSKTKEEYIFDYFLGLFEIYFQCAISGMPIYRNLKSKDCAFQEKVGCNFYPGEDDYEFKFDRVGDALYVGVPKKSKVATRLIEFIVELSESMEMTGRSVFAQQPNKDGLV